MAGQYKEPYEKLSKRTKEVHRAYVSLIEEIEAMDWYQQRIDVTEDEPLKKILEHNRDEEKEHASILLERIRRNGEAFAKELKIYLFRWKRDHNNGSDRCIGSFCHLRAGNEKNNLTRNGSYAIFLLTGMIPNWFR